MTNILYEIGTDRQIVNVNRGLNVELFQIITELTVQAEMAGEHFGVSDSGVPQPAGSK